jgi:hypothetical protein
MRMLAAIYLEEYDLVGCNTVYLGTSPPIFGGTSTELNNVTTEKTVLFIVTAVRT